MQEIIFLLKQFKNTSSAQLCILTQYMFIIYIYVLNENMQLIKVVIY